MGTLAFPEPLPAHGIKRFGQVDEGDVRSFILLPVLFLDLPRDKHARARAHTHTHTHTPETNNRSVGVAGEEKGLVCVCVCMCVHACYEGGVWGVLYGNVIRQSSDLYLSSYCVLEVTLRAALTVLVHFIDKSTTHLLSLH